MEPTPVTLTKLLAPAPRARSIRRARLMDKMALQPETDLILVSAPAGYGKTTLLAEWAREQQQSGTGVIWYALDESDDDPVTFTTYLVTGLQRQPGAGRELEAMLQALRSSPEIELGPILPALVNAILNNPRETVLILDDYHAIHAPAIHQAVEFLIRHRPTHFHIAIGSRANPPLPLARLRSKGRLVEIQAADLCFTEDESGRFLRETMRIAIPQPDAGRLLAQVEGWAAGLQLAALSLAGRSENDGLPAPISGGQRCLAEYLLEEVINRQPEEIQSFLLYTSILERVSAPLCDAILGIDESARLLQQIEQANLFILALDEEGRWFRYHPLFRDFLRQWLNQTQPDRAAALHKAASDWYAGQDALHEAAHHAFQCRDEVFAADFVERHSFSLIIRSEIATIYAWCATFPEEVIQKRPLLCIFQALALAYHFQAKNRARVVARLAQAERRLAEIDDPQQKEVANAFMAVVQPFLSMIPDPHIAAHQHLAQVMDRLAGCPPDDPARFPWLLIAGYSRLALHQVTEARQALEDALPFAWQAGLFFGAIETTFHLAELAHSQGRLEDALRLCQACRESLEAASQGAHLALPALGCLEIASGAVEFERDHLAEAEHNLQQGMQRLSWGMYPYYLGMGALAQFRLFQAQGRFAEALAGLERLELIWPDIQFHTRGLRALVALRLTPGESALQAAQAWLQSYPAGMGGTLPLPGMGPMGSAEVFYQANLTWARLQIATGSPEAARPYLAQQLTLAREQNLTGRAIELRLLEAQLEQQQGQTRPALAALVEALAWAEPAGFVRVFDQSALLDDLIHLAVRQGAVSGYGEKILAAIRAWRGDETAAIAAPAPRLSSLPPDEAPIIPLSERELDVLGLMASGATNQAIAERLVITLGTVKSHINHILGKLNAANRTEAVARARQAGLL